MRFRGRTKSKKNTWVQSTTGRWHRINPTNGQFTACGIKIGENWGFPTEVEPDLIKMSVCMYPECRGIEPSTVIGG
jgi:hypothetical protein